MSAGKEPLVNGDAREAHFPPLARDGAVRGDRDVQGGRAVECAGECVAGDVGAGAGGRGGCSRPAGRGAAALTHHDECGGDLAALPEDSPICEETSARQYAPQFLVNVFAAARERAADLADAEGETE